MSDAPDPATLAAATPRPAPAPASAPTPEPEPHADAPVGPERMPDEVHVRMYRALEPSGSGDADYRGLLGDCFLLRLTRGDASAHVLIDCGMLLGSPQATRRMAAIARDIVATCGGRLDLLVVTHEHWDHLSGFSQAADVLLDPARLMIDTVWMAWTEDPDDPVAQGLRARFDQAGVALTKIAARLREDGTRFGADAARTRLGGLDSFMGLPAAASPQGSPRLATRDILQKLKQAAREVHYLKPGERRQTPGAVSLATHVLGPPQDLARLFRDKPSTKNPETYLDAPSLDGKQLLRFADGVDPDPACDSPFAPDYCRVRIAEMDANLAGAGPADARAREFLRQRYYGTAGTKPWELAAMQRRRIDGDWLGTAGATALKLDSDTNNTSLVLAFELPAPSRDVLLFAGDAQVGNWESWHDRTYREADGTPVTAEQLLGRTLLYKVGHHGSHNATLATRGLEMMTHEALFALIPTDEDLGKRQGSGWQMPNPRVRAALRQRTGGRILRNDRRYPSPGRTAAQNATLREDPEIRSIPQDFLDRLVETDLYLEYPLLMRSEP